MPPKRRKPNRKNTFDRYQGIVAKPLKNQSNSYDDVDDDIDDFDFNGTFPFLNTNQDDNDGDDTTTTDDDDNDDDDEDEDNEINGNSGNGSNHNNKWNKSNANNNDSRDSMHKKMESIRKSLELPGGSAVVKFDPKTANEQTERETAAVLRAKILKRGEAVDEIVKGVRDYLDMLFSTTVMAGIKASSDRPEEVIPVIVTNILAFNNIEFATVDLYRVSPGYLNEPIWYSINIAARNLTLYFDRSLFDDFAIKFGDCPVTFSDGFIAVERYNPFAQHPTIDAIRPADINYAIVCDHVCQHILSELMQPDYRASVMHEGIHYNYRRCGTTLHSMFDVEQLRRMTPNCQFNVISNDANIAMPRTPFDLGSGILDILGK